MLFAELDLGGLHGASGGDARLAVLGTAIGLFVARAITTPLAIRIGVDAQHRHERARRELRLTGVVLTPVGVAVAGTL